MRVFYQHHYHDRKVPTPLLGVIAENRVGDAVLPDTVWKLAACNPPDCAADNGSELKPSLANRVCHLTWETDKRPAEHLGKDV